LTVKKRSTAISNIIYIEGFPSQELKRDVKISILLPPDYLQSIKPYPVIYLHDGQNLFDDSIAFKEEWGVDEIMAERHRAGKPLAIVVAIHSGQTRMEELSPFKHPKHGGGKGNEYLAFISKTLKPHIDKSYRTLPDPDFTTIGGSSLGGLISAWAFLGESDNITFGNAIIFSPAVWFNPQIMKYRPNTLATSKRVFIYGGEKEGGNIAAYSDSLDLLFRNIGFNTKAIIDPQGEHNELFWRKHLPHALDWILNKK
jgi:predicted alpha/beta superfamily hydrolase